MVNTIASVLTQKGAVVWFLPPGASVYEAIEKMAEKGVGAAASELHHRQVPCLRPRGAPGRAPILRLYGHFVGGRVARRPIAQMVLSGGGGNRTPDDGDQK